MYILGALKKTYICTFVHLEKLKVNDLVSTVGQD